ncbi:putative endonuclease lcl3 [Rhinocladiella similis]
MQWPKWWSSSTKDEADSNESATSQATKAWDSIGDKVTEARESVERNAATALPAQVKAFAEPQTIVATAVLTASCLGLFKFYKSYLRRIPQATNITPGFLRRRSLVGRVTSVGDGDNFRFYHTPGGRLAGWGWFPGRRVPTEKKELKDQTVHLRLAGVDAPELAHFGRPSQPYAQEALDWLTAYVLGRRVRAYVYKIDQYNRVVGTAYVWRGLMRRDVGLQMLRAGMATVYEAKSGAEFGEGLEKKYRNAEWWAKTKRKGMWAGRKKDYESPREYKTRYGMGSPQDETK